MYTIQKHLKQANKVKFIIRSIKETKRQRLQVFSYKLNSKILNENL